MNIWKRMIVLLFCCPLFLTATIAMAQIKSWEDPLPSGPMNDDYRMGPDSKPQANVPKGEFLSLTLDHSVHYPGSVNIIEVYVPKQYDGKTPACVYVAMDGFGFAVPTVFDNLLARGEIPVQIAIAVRPGSVPSTDGNENPRWNRSLEFDAVNDRFCRFLYDEVFPAVENLTTKDGRTIRLSRNPNDAACGGSSTGGVCAFSLAWQRPDRFRRVFSAVGTYVAMRGAHEYSTLVRKTEPKPIRIFMQDGHCDQCFGDVGDWWMENVSLKRSLEFMGYDINWTWGTGPHSGAQANSLFPDAIRWLWRDWPTPIQAAPNPVYSEHYKMVVDPQQTWKESAPSFKGVPTSLTATPDGTICIGDNNGTVWRLDEKNTFQVIGKTSAPILAIASGANGTIFAVIDQVGKKKIVSFELVSEKAKTVVEDVTTGGLTVLNDGRLYLFDKNGNPQLLLTNNITTNTITTNTIVNHMNGIAVTPDGKWLVTIDSTIGVGTSYRVNKDGTLDAPQQMYWLHVKDKARSVGSGFCTFDTEGRLYVATELGLGICDRNGRERLILPSPVEGGQAAVDAVAFGGKDFKTLYIISGGKIFMRKLKSVGHPDFLPSAKLPKWGAG